MIAYIEGVVVSRTEKSVVINTGGIGYRVFVSPDTLSTLPDNKTVSLSTYLIVKENILALYGFLSEEEVVMFEMLIGVSGVGPRSAIGILGIAPPKILKSAISAGDTSYLTKVSGVGKRSAEKIILDLREKFGPTEDGVSETLKDDYGVIEALMALGYSATQARRALREVPKEFLGVSDKTKEALRILNANN